MSRSRPPRGDDMDELGRDMELAELLRAVDPASYDANYWMRFRSWVVERAAPELARRTELPEVQAQKIVLLMRNEFESDDEVTEELDSMADAFNTPSDDTASDVSEEADVVESGDAVEDDTPPGVDDSTVAESAPADADPSEDAPTTDASEEDETTPVA